MKHNLDVLINKTKNYIFCDPRFYRLVLKGVCNTRFVDICKSGITDLQSIGLMTDDKGQQIDDSLSYGKLCELILGMPDTPTKNHAAYIAAKPFIRTTLRDDMRRIRGNLSGQSDFQKSVDFCAVQNFLSKEIQNSVYSLCKENDPPRFFYWWRYMTLGEYLQYACQLSGFNREVRDIQGHLEFPWREPISDEYDNEYDDSPELDDLIDESSEDEPCAAEDLPKMRYVGSFAHSLYIDCYNLTSEDRMHYLGKDILEYTGTHSANEIPRYNSTALRLIQNLILIPVAAVNHYINL